MSKAVPSSWAAGLLAKRVRRDDCDMVVMCVWVWVGIGSR